MCDTYYSSVQTNSTYLMKTIRLVTVAVAVVVAAAAVASMQLILLLMILTALLKMMISVIPGVVVVPDVDY